MIVSTAHNPDSGVNVNGVSCSVEGILHASNSHVCDLWNSISPAEDSLHFNKKETSLPT
jgi:hypothetical protein